MGQHHVPKQKDVASVRFSKCTAACDFSPPPRTTMPAEPGSVQPGSDNPPTKTISHKGGIREDRIITDGEGHVTQRHVQRSKSSFRLADVMEVGRQLHRRASFRGQPKAKRGIRWGVIGVKNSLAEDFQFHCLDMEWGNLLMLVFGVYFCVSWLFAAAFYYISVVCEERHHLMGDLPTHMSLAEACFWFSVNNLLTIGYGAVVPGSRTACIISTLEHFMGIMMSSLLLGIVVTKASLPSSKIVFSRSCLITKRNGVPHLLVRVGNTRGNFLAQPEIRMSYLRRLVTQEGEVTFKALRMDYIDPPHMAPCINLAHEIDSNSPLYHKTKADIEDDDGAIFVSMSATDEVSTQTVYARQVYRAEDVLFDHRYQDVLLSKNGMEYVDFRVFHNVVPISEVAGKHVLDLTTRLGHRTFAAFKAANNRSNQNLKPSRMSTDSQEGTPKGDGTPKSSAGVEPVAIPQSLSPIAPDDGSAQDSETPTLAPDATSASTSGPTVGFAGKFPARLPNSWLGINRDRPASLDETLSSQTANPVGFPASPDPGADPHETPTLPEAATVAAADADTCGGSGGAWSESGEGGRASDVRYGGTVLLSTESAEDLELEGAIKVGQTGQYRCY